MCLLHFPPIPAFGSLFSHSAPNRLLPHTLIVRNRHYAPPLSLFSLSFSALVLNAPILPRFLAQGEVLRPLSEIDDLSSTFSKLNTTINGPRGSGIVGDRGSREGSSVAEWPLGEEVPYWLGQQALETESVPRDKHWSSQLSPNLDSKHLCRTSSYPEQQQNQHFSTEPILVFYFDFLFFSCV